MSEKKKQIYKPSPVSGFPEWLPEVRIVEQQWLDQIRRVFESYGFASIETPAVEELNVIAAKGEDVDKEIYTLERLQADPDDKKDARLALHFDQTVPFARYTAQHFNELTFPFKRYQMQKVWRGERPQAGRMREFYQCDIDVINPDNLPISFDADIPAIIWEILSSLPGMENEDIEIHINNRKIIVGYLSGIGIDTIELITDITRLIDKRAKISQVQFQEGLRTILENSSDADEKIGKVNKYLEVTSILSARRHNIIKTIELVQQELSKEFLYNDTDHSDFDKGIEELEAVFECFEGMPDIKIRPNLTMVRGLDYYTGTVYETVFLDDPGYGSICSGGRYDDLAGSYINKHLPGVGISIGFSRLFDRLRVQGKLPVSRKCPTDVLILPPRDVADLPAMKDVERTLRGRGYNVEVAHGKKLNKQMAYAEKKGIPFVWFAEDGEVKNMATGEQVKADANDWSANA